MGNSALQTALTTAPPGVTALGALVQINLAQPGSPSADPLQAAAIYLATAQELTQQQSTSAVYTPAMLSVDLRILRSAAKAYYIRASLSGNPPDPSIATVVDNAFASQTYTSTLIPTLTPAAATWANQLALFFLAVPIGGFNDAASFIRANYSPQ